MKTINLTKSETQFMPTLDFWGTNKEQAKPKTSKFSIHMDILNFEEFWNMYDKKVGRKKCENKWKKISEVDKIRIAKHLPKYIESTPNKQYRKNPETYINGECWHDEIIDYEKVKSIKVNDAKVVQADFLKDRYGIS